MKRKAIVFLASAVAVISVLDSALLGIGKPASAQQGPGRDPATREVPLSKVLADLGKETETVVLADSTVAQIPVRFRSDTSLTVDQRLKLLVRLLPAGSVWAKLYVPKPAGERWNADNITQYARSLAQLTGRPVGGTSPEGTVNILGRPIPQAEAEEHIRGLDLRLVYLVSNPSISRLGISSDRLPQMAQQFRAMNQADRVRMFMEMQEQQQQMMKLLFEGMSDQERIEFKRSLIDSGKGRN